MKYMLMMHTGQDADQGILELVAGGRQAPHRVPARRSTRNCATGGEMVFNEGLTFPDQARIVRANGAGTPAVTDGPFAESKEFLIGFWIVDVETPERAYEIAAKASAPPGQGRAARHPDRGATGRRARRRWTPEPRATR